MLYFIFADLNYAKYSMNIGGNMNNSVKISAINVYHPAKIRGNEYFIKKHGDIKNINNLFESLGKRQRYVSDLKSENVLTMAFKSAEPIVDDSNIDIIIFASTTVEYLSPTHALFIHRKFNIKHNCICIDMNINCLSMLAVLEQAAMMLKLKASYCRALIISTDQVSRYAKPHEFFPEALFGDAAVAMILDKVKDNSGAGLIDSQYYTDSQYADTIVFPHYGLSHSQNMQEEKFHWDNFTGELCVPFAIEAIQFQLEKHHLKLNDVSCFFFSQLSRNYIGMIKNALNLSWEQIEYIGDEYGYTGGNSPLVAYAHRLKKGLLHEGDIIVFWSFGAGYQTGVLLWKV